MFAARSERARFNLKELGPVPPIRLAWATESGLSMLPTRRDVFRARHLPKYPGVPCKPFLFLRSATWVRLLLRAPDLRSPEFRRDFCRRSRRSRNNDSRGRDRPPSTSGSRLGTVSATVLSFAASLSPPLSLFHRA